MLSRQRAKRKLRLVIQIAPVELRDRHGSFADSQSKGRVCARLQSHKHSISRAKITHGQVFAIFAQ